LDPFGGIAGFAFHALQHGLTWIGIELEQKFVDLGQQNIALWNARYSRMPRWGTAILLQGDSRRLSEMVREAQAVISSPPWETSTACEDPNYRTGRLTSGGPLYNDYGHHPAQLGNMPEGDVDAVVDCAISSPPYTNSIAQGEAANDAVARKERKRQAGVDMDKSANVGGPNSVLNQIQSYGHHPGQLAAMPTGNVDGRISSPPFGGSELSTDEKFRTNMDNPGRNWSSGAYSSGNIAIESSPTFWQAARVITEQVYQVLKPGGVAIWVLKAFVRNKAIVDFPGQWQRMCESCGFETVEIIHALLTEDRGAQYALDGELHEKTIKRASFFRRLHERKYPHLAIDHEVVLCQHKPM